MDRRLYKAGFIAIPLIEKEDAQLGLMKPNFMIIEKLSTEKVKSEIPNQEGVFELIDCVKITWKLVRRKIFLNDEFDEKIFIQETRAIPVDFFPMLITHERILQNIQLLNVGLSLFQFQDSLQYFKCEIDSNVLQEIITSEIDSNIVLNEQINYNLN